jgi:predicted phage terminase large subunit-like protein
VLKAKVTGIVLEEPEGSKRARVEAITPLWEAGNVFLPDRSIYPEIDAIIEEWVSFGPGCAFDDRTDAMSQALKRLGSSITVDTTLENFVRW